MNKLLSWLRTFRPHNGLLSVLMTYISLSKQSYFSQLNKNHLWLFWLAIFLIVSLSMSANDWYDRKKDLLKNKRFALENANKLLMANLFIWLFLGLLLVRLGKTDLISFMPLLLVHYFLSPFYSLAQKIIFLPTLIVAFAVASLMLYANFLPQTDKLPIIISFTVVFLFIFSREIIKDFLDIETDKNFKKTLPLLYGKKISYRIIFICQLSGVALMVYFNYLNAVVLILIFLTYYFLQKDKYYSAKTATSAALAVFFLNWWIS